MLDEGITMLKHLWKMVYWHNSGWMVVDIQYVYPHKLGDALMTLEDDGWEIFEIHPATDGFNIVVRKPRE
jgi:regulation of enolase protein 1 (concanavalin A-like superfamily)